MKRAVVFFACIFLFFCIALNAFSFTVTTKVKDPEQEIKTSTELEEVSFKINITGLRDWHSEYFFVPHRYTPRFLSEDGGVVEGERKISFRVFRENTQLDCAWSPFGVTSLHKEGETQRCDLRGERDGIIEYRLDGIAGPDYKVTQRGLLGGLLTSSKYGMVGSDSTVSIDFSVRFRTDEGTGSGGEFSEWVSTEQGLSSLHSGAGAGQEGEAPSPEPIDQTNICKPVISEISYNGVDFSEPSSFSYTNYGDTFSVLVGVQELCSVSELSLGFWNSSDLSGAPEFEIDFLSGEIEQLELQGTVSKNIMLSEAPYPEKLYFAARVVNAAGNEFYSDSVEFYFPGAEQPGQPPEGGETPAAEDLAGCNPCRSIVGCLACLDHSLAKNSFE